MLRWIVLALLLANAGFWVWRQGWLEPLHGVIGAGPEGDREPERLALQVKPQAIRLVPDGTGPAATSRALAASPRPAAASAPASDPATLAAAPATVCLEAGPYGLADAAAAEANAKIALPQAAWSLREITPVWWVAMGPYADGETMQKKREELRRRGVAVQQARTLAGGASYLILSRHDSRAAADAELAALGERGVHSARSLLAIPPQQALRLREADAAQQAALAALGPVRLRGKVFAPCPAEN